MAGCDDSAVGGTLTWPDGDNSDGTFTVPILEDAIAEPSETIHLLLTNAGGAIGAPSSAVLTLAANDTISGAGGGTNATTSSGGGSVGGGAGLDVR
jgi:hypothetical protein